MKKIGNLVSISRLVGRKTSSLIAGLALVIGGAGLPLVLAASADAASCTPTGFVRDNINLTAAQIGGNVRGTLNATGCNIGVYYDKQHPGNVSQANIYGANYFGVVVDGGQGNVRASVQQSSIHNIGETPFDGTQHGVGIYYYGQNTSGNVTGRVSQNHVYDYQKGGIVINGENANVPVNNNTVNGLGPVDFIAQNGIQISRGDKGNVTQNTVTDNAYTGSDYTTSAGILVFGGYGDPLVTDITISQNTLRGNDVGVSLSNYNADGSSGPATPTNINVNHNTVSNSAVTNQYYQAGISDAGNSDRIVYNLISGDGYAPSNGAVFTAPIDVGAPYSINPILSHNMYDGRPYNP